MTRAELEELEAALRKLTSIRRQLGGFDANAEAIMLICEALTQIVTHLRENAPRQKKSK